MSKSFYTNVIQWGNQLLVRSIKNGIPDKQKIKFQPTLFTASSKANVKTEWKTLYDVPVYELHPGDINDCKEFIEIHKGVEGFDIYGQTNYGIQYIAEQHPEDITSTTTDTTAENGDCGQRCSDVCPSQDSASRTIRETTSL